MAKLGEGILGTVGLDQRRRPWLGRVDRHGRGRGHRRNQGLIFATWWTYFAIPWAEVLELHRDRMFDLELDGNIVIFGSLAAIGAGLHVAAYYLEHETSLTLTGTVLSTVIPVTIYIASLYGIYASFTRHLDPFHLSLLAGSAAVLALAVRSPSPG